MNGNMGNEGRPNPDELLKKVQREEAEAARCELKIFFGACPGVGKTYAMLSAARVHKEQGGRGGGRGRDPRPYRNCPPAGVVRSKIVAISGSAHGEMYENRRFRGLFGSCYRVRSLLGI